jgi:hypothetical protein
MAFMVYLIVIYGGFLRGELKACCRPGDSHFHNALRQTQCLGEVAVTLIT